MFFYLTYFSPSTQQHLYPALPIILTNCFPEIWQIKVKTNETHIIWNNMFIQVCENGEVVHVAAAVQAVVEKKILSEISNW